MTTYLVTGANRGIGLELARQLTARGDEVVATARDPEAASDLRATGARVEPLDVTDPASIAALAAALAGAPVDVLVNNAGVSAFKGPLGSLDHASLASTYAVNAVGPLRVTEALLPNLRAGARRVVANVTSRMGSIEDNGSGGSYAYRASKAALNAITKSLALDLEGEGFTCFVLHPGWVRTDMGGAHAPLEVEASARGIVALLDGAGPATSGRFWNHDGEELPW